MFQPCKHILVLAEYQIRRFEVSGELTWLACLHLVMGSSTMESLAIPPRLLDQNLPNNKTVTRFAPGTCQPSAPSPFPATKGLPFSPQSNPVIAITSLPFKISLPSQLTVTPISASCPTGANWFQKSDDCKTNSKFEHLCSRVFLACQ